MQNEYHINIAYIVIYVKDMYQHPKWGNAVSFLWKHKTPFLRPNFNKQQHHIKVENDTNINMNLWFLQNKSANTGLILYVDGLVQERRNSIANAL